MLKLRTDILGVQAEEFSESDIQVILRQDERELSDDWQKLGDAPDGVLSLLALFKYKTAKYRGASPQEGLQIWADCKALKEMLRRDLARKFPHLEDFTPERLCINARGEVYVRPLILVQSANKSGENVYDLFS